MTYLQETLGYLGNPCVVDSYHVILSMVCRFPRIELVHSFTNISHRAQTLSRSSAMPLVQDRGQSPNLLSRD